MCNGNWQSDLTKEGIEPNPGPSPPWLCPNIVNGKVCNKHNSRDRALCQQCGWRNEHVSARQKARNARACALASRRAYAKTEKGKIAYKKYKSTDAGKAMQKKAIQQYRKTERGRASSMAAQKRMVPKVKAYKLQVKLELSKRSNAAGMCERCGLIPVALCHVHHMDPDRKKLEFNRMRYTYACVDNEVARNTVVDEAGNEVILLKVLCEPCHMKDAGWMTGDVKGRGSAVLKARAAVNELKRQHKHCAYGAACLTSTVMCVEGNEHTFHWDHFIPAKSGKALPVEAQKIASVSYFVALGKRAEAVAEAKKCRLLHAACHFHHTLQQAKDDNSWLLNEITLKSNCQRCPHLLDFLLTAGYRDKLIKAGVYFEGNDGDSDEETQASNRSESSSDQDSSMSGERSQAKRGQKRIREDENDVVDRQTKK
jgi:hypothetical protein